MSVKTRIEALEKKLNPQPGSYIFVERGDGKGQKQADEILKAEPDANVLVVSMVYVD